MSTANSRVARFLVEHERCGGAKVDEPNEADLTERGYYATVRCPGCGEIIRVEVEWAAVIPDLARYAGVSPEEFQALALTEGGLEEIAKRIQERQLFVPDVLIQIMRARGEQQNN